MRCLVLSPFVPCPPEDGGSARIYEIMKGLSREHEVDLLTLAAPIDASWEGAAQLRQQGFDVETVFHQPQRSAAALGALLTHRSFDSTLFYCSAFGRGLDARLRERSYDIVQCERDESRPRTLLAALMRSRATRSRRPRRTARRR